MSRRKYRDASTGTYVSAEYAKENPDTTVREDDTRVAKLEARVAQLEDVVARLPDALESKGSARPEV